MKFKSITSTIPNRVKVEIGELSTVGYTVNLLATYSEALSIAKNKRQSFNLSVIDQEGEIIKEYDQATPPVSKQFY